MGIFQDKRISHREDQGRVSVQPAVAGSRGPAELRLRVGLGSRTAGAGIPPPLLSRPVMRPLFSHFRDFVSSWVKWVMVMSTPRAGKNGCCCLTEQSAQDLVTECSGEMGCESREDSQDNQTLLFRNQDY